MSAVDALTASAAMPATSSAKPAAAGDVFADLFQRFLAHDAGANDARFDISALEQERLRLEAELIDALFKRLGKNGNFAASMEKILDWFGSERGNFLQQLSDFSAVQPSGAGELLEILAGLQASFTEKFSALGASLGEASGGVRSRLSNLQIEASLNFSAVGGNGAASPFSDEEIKSAFGVQRTTVKMQIQMQMQSELQTSSRNMLANGGTVVQINGTYMELSAALMFLDPLVLDLNGDGLQLKSLDDGVIFDLRGDGEAVRCGFAQGDDALLFLDADGDGLCNDGKELFGNQTGDANGFAKLQKYDGNGDGRIDENDEIYSQLRVWNDWNGDGKCDADEVRDLRSAAVQFINLGYGKTAEEHNGNLVTERGAFGTFAGEMRDIVDAQFRYAR
jgi:hypothetical protein